MAEKKDQLAPIVIKKIKKGGHGHHGGAWKIAYADFVTAMMAFFLLMWLLGSTAEGDMKGIADYFNNPLRVSALGGGSGAGDATSLVKGGGQSLTKSSGQVEKGKRDEKQTKYSGPAEEQAQAARAELARAEGELLKGLKEKVEGEMNKDGSLAGMKEQIRIDETEEGLRIQIVDSQNRPMFSSGSAELQPHARYVLRSIGQLLNDVPQKLSLSGHTDSTPFPGGERGYSNWELSADRANAARRELIAGGYEERKVLRVMGVGSALPFNTAEPNDPMNRRITLIVMKSDAIRAVIQETGTAHSSPPVEEGKTAEDPPRFIEPIPGLNQEQKSH